MAELVIAVGGIFLSPLLQVAFDRITSSRKFIEFFKGKKGIEFDEEVLARLDRTLYKISDVLEDAEVKEGAKGVRTWLAKVRAEVNHADDLLDEFNYECLRLQQLSGDDFLDQVLHNQTEPDLKVHRCCFPFRKPKNDPGYADATLFIGKLMSQVKNVTDTLEGFVKEIKELGLQKLDPKKKYPYPSPTTSLVDKSQIFGRDDEKEKLVERVLSDGGASDVSVIAITGMGGIGKSTLAQLVYNDDQVKKKFSTRAWVCVSEDYDPLRVTKALLKEVSSVVVDDKDEFNHHQVKLKENLAGKCFLIILDDMWDEDYNKWDSLKAPLKGKRGSKIIVTTRNEKVANIMQTEPFHRLQTIQEDQSWCLFKSHAFDNGDHTSSQEFVTIGKDIVKKCKGLPLAIKTVAGALRYEKNTNMWHAFLSSDDWAADGGILPALSLSYKHLPPHLKCCFAFCAIFHKDVPFDKEEVVLLWMANDLVRTQKVGRVYFDQLRSRSFFESANEKVYLMHDLINDLARYASGTTCIRLEDCQAPRNHQSIRENELPPDLLHFSYLSIDDETSERFSVLAQTQSLRSFLPIHQDRWQHNLPTNFFPDMCQGFQRLRALNLSMYHILMVPDSIGDLKHLRFLNLASTEIKKLPNAISKCVNLQTLILSNCQKLDELPKDMILLINLQHLDLRGVGEPLIKTMATWLRMFKDIQNISVVVDKIQGSELELLVRLQVYDSLNIIGLGDTDVATIERAKRVGLIDKYYIKDLTLEWGDVVESSQEELNKFVKLHPHTNTKKLSIEGYTGSILPDWLGNSAFTNMKYLEISNCNNILSFPEGGLATPNLKTLVVESCSKMKSLPARMHTQLPLLTELHIEECPEIECFPEGGLPSSLEILYIWDCLKMRNCQTNWGLQTLSSLKVVWFRGFEDMLFPEEGLLPTTLQKLFIDGFRNLESVNEKGLQHLSSLQTLWIFHCPKLKYLPQQKLSSSLSELSVYNCELVESFPEGLASSLSQLHIYKCRKLAARIEREKGEDWPKVSHIPDIVIDYQLI